MTRLRACFLLTKVLQFFKFSLENNFSYNFETKSNMIEKYTQLKTKERRMLNNIWATLMHFTHNSIYPLVSKTFCLNILLE